MLSNLQIWQHSGGGQLNTFQSPCFQNFSLAIITTWFCYFCRSAVAQVSIRSSTVARPTAMESQSSCFSGWSNLPAWIYLYACAYTIRMRKVLARIQKYVSLTCIQAAIWLIVLLDILAWAGKLTLKKILRYILSFFETSPLRCWPVILTEQDTCYWEQLALLVVKKPEFTYLRIEFRPASLLAIGKGLSKLLCHVKASLLDAAPGTLLNGIELDPPWPVLQPYFPFHTDTTYRACHSTIWKVFTIFWINT